ncbi:MAG: HlyD family efflux transporter periplasmic adaptor subunit [Vicinamibacteraceae bacterium]
MMRWLVGIGGLAAIGAAAFGAPTARGVLSAGNAAVPTGRVVRGTVKADVVATGEIKAAKAELLMVPPTGVPLRILTLVSTGARVKKGDLVVSFDPSDQERIVDEQRSTLREAELEIAKTQANTAARQAQDDLDLLTARFDLSKAELDVQASEVRPQLEARKAQLTLEEAQQRLAQLGRDRASRTQSDEAAMAVAREKETKARFAIDTATRILGQMTLRASFDGVVSVKDNQNVGYFFPGMTFSEFRTGDQVQSGSPIAEVLDLSQLEIGAAIDESQRTQLTAGRPATLVLDALDGRSLEAKVANVGGFTPQRFNRNTTPTRTFEATLSLTAPAVDLRPGLTGLLTIAAAPRAGVLHVPRGAVFLRDGATVVFVRDGGRFTPAPVKVTARTETAAVVEGVAEGTEIALADPTRGGGGGAGGAAASGPALPGAGSPAVGVRR